MENNNSLIGTIKSMAILAAMVIASGLALYAIWSAIKAVLWLISPYRGHEIDNHKSIGLSFGMAMKTPYTWIMIWSGGWLVIFIACVAFAWNDPHSIMWSESAVAAKWSVYSFIVISFIGFLYGLMLELAMIFNFREWVYNAKELGHI